MLWVEFSSELSVQLDFKKSLQLDFKKSLQFDRPSGIKKGLLTKGQFILPYQTQSCLLTPPQEQTGAQAKPQELEFPVRFSNDNRLEKTALQDCQECLQINTCLSN